MAVTIDPRPSYFGDRMIVTGSYTATETTIDLSGLLVSIDFAGINPSAINGELTTSDNSAATGASTDIINLVDSCVVSGTTITIVPMLKSEDTDGAGTGGAAIAGTTTAGTFFAIGRRS